VTAIFITATGTGVGKTFVAASLIRQFRQAGRAIEAIKPVVSGFDPAQAETSDPGALLRALGLPVTAEEIDRIAPWRFRAALSPTMAAVAAVTLMAASAGLAGCASSTSSGSANSSASVGASASAASCTFAGVQDELYAKGVLTVATDQPAYPPWFENNTPSNGQGYEGAVADAVAAQLGFKPSQVKWAYEPFDSSYAPGPKKFDFDINEISYTAARAQVVTFSDSYHDVQQALVALKSSPIVTKHTSRRCSAACTCWSGSTRR